MRPAVLFVCFAAAVSVRAQVGDPSAATAEERHLSVFQARPQVVVTSESTPVTDELIVTGTPGTSSFAPRVTLKGPEFFQPANTNTTNDGISLLLGVNRVNNRQLWLTDTTETAPSSTNTALRFMIADQTADISAMSTDTSTRQNLSLNNGGGNVGIGVTGSGISSKVFVAGSVAGTPALTAKQQATYVIGSTSRNDSGAIGWTNTTVDSGVTNTGYSVATRGNAYLLGGGTLTAAYGLWGDVRVTAANTGTIANAFGLYLQVKKNEGVITNGYGVYVEDVTSTNDYGVYQAGADDSNYLAGDVTIGPAIPPPPSAQPMKLQVNGSVNVTGSLTANTVVGAVYQDLAEWVPSTENLAPGTVVVLDPVHSNHVIASSTSYDTTVAGVVSAQPGFILGESGPSKEQIATTGRVKVHVDATRAAIRIGDLLVSSDKPGTAMKSEPVSISGRRFHQPGTIIGKALEPLESGEGEILVLLSLQ